MKLLCLLNWDTKIFAAVVEARSMGMDIKSNEDFPMLTTQNGLIIFQSDLKQVMNIQYTRFMKL